MAILFGMLYLNWTFVTSLYFAVTTLSTGGLLGPPCVNNTENNPHTCEFGNIPAVFTGFYAMIGVPLYFLTLGIFASAVIQHSLNARHKAKLYSPIEARDFIYATKLLSDEQSTTLSLGIYTPSSFSHLTISVALNSTSPSTSNSFFYFLEFALLLVVIGEFILLELMRLGVTDLKQIDRIRIKFHELDIKKNNVLDYDELCQGGYLIQSHSHSHTFLGNTNGKSQQEFLHLTNDTLPPFHNNENLPGILLMPRQPTPDEEQDLREEIKEEIHQMQRNRAASLVKIEYDNIYSVKE